MPHFRVDDALHSHPKAQRAGDEAIGMWTLAGSYCMAYLTDGFIPAWWVKQRTRGNSKAKRLVEAGLWHAEERDGEPGYQFHDWLGVGRQDSKAHIEAERRSNAARQEVARNPQLRAAIRKRDGDVCRYCATPVEWNNRRGPTGGTYDHVDPHGGTTIDNLVVCCRGCNSRKGRRTPEQAGLRLRPVGSGADSKPVLNGSKSGSRSVSSPIPTQPNPTQPVVNSVVTPGGDVTLATARGPNCSRHPHGISEPCGACADARRAFEAAESERAALAAEARLARARDIRECDECDDFGWALDDGEPVEPATRCPNHDWETTHA